MPDFLRLLKRGVRGLATDRRGNVAMIFALCLVPVVMVIGAAIDLGNAQRVRQQLQDSTDTAVLAVARDALHLTDAQLQPVADAYLKSSYRYKQIPYSITKLTFDRTTVTAVLDTKVNVPTSFLQIAGIKTVPVTAHAVSKGLGFEIAMVLDTSGSMTESAGSGGSKISALKTASNTFLTTMFGTQATSQRVSIAIVPFAASVDVGTANKTATWMDTTDASKVSDEDFVDTTHTRFGLFTDMNVSWAGCVITRLAPYDVDDTTPTSTKPDTLFAPWFAPDEPGDKNKPVDDSYDNDYLDDNGGTCSGSDSNWSDAKRQGQTCKYKGAKIARGVGPNYLCDSTPITPLTNVRATLNSAVTALSANGNTNIFEGLMWGWRALSPGAPFTQGKAYTAPNNRKVIILMTDGENNLNGITDSGNINHSAYSAYGYAIKGRVGTTSSNNSTLTTYLNTKTQTACTNAKAAGMTIYTIAFGADASASVSLLKSCASDPTFFYQPVNSSDLQPVFLAIAESINRLRLAE